MAKPNKQQHQKQKQHTNNINRNANSYEKDAPTIHKKNIWKTKIQVECILMSCCLLGSHMHLNSVGRQYKIVLGEGANICNRIRQILTLIETFMP